MHGNIDGPALQALRTYMQTQPGYVGGIHGGERTNPLPPGLTPSALNPGFEGHLPQPGGPVDSELIGYQPPPGYIPGIHGGERTSPLPPNVLQALQHMKQMFPAQAQQPQANPALKRVQAVAQARHQAQSLLHSFAQKRRANGPYR